MAMNVLIAEDEFLLGLLLTEFLLEAGHTVLGPAMTAREALALARATPPDLALIDIELRDGDSGIALAETLGREGVLSIFVSAQPDLARSNPRHAIGYIPKPYTPALVIETVRWVEAVRNGAPAVRAPPLFEPFEGAKALYAHAPQLPAAI
jgi:two-component system, response regulator PdtaR